MGHKPQEAWPYPPRPRSPVQEARDRLASAARRGESPEVLKAYRDELEAIKEQTARDEAEARLDRYIRSVVGKAPPLTPEQKERLALLLTPALDNKAAS